MRARSVHLGSWPYRICWLLLPVVAGPAIGDALGHTSRAVQSLVTLSAWGIWGSTLLAALVPRTVTLTVVRLVTPGAVALTAWSAVGADRPSWAGVGVAASAICLLAVSAPSVADEFVDGSSYGDERRVSLRAPATVALGPAPVAWAALAASVVTGPLLLAARQWTAGAAASAAGAVIAVILVPRLHQLSRRWLVFVPAGVVVHDPLQLTEPVLFPRHLLRRIGPAPVDGDALDVTGGAPGLALEVLAAEPISVGVRRGRETIEHVGVKGLVVTPGRPASTLEVAEDRRLPIA